MGLDEAAVPFDTTVPHVARVYNYWLGGKDNYAADRALGDRVIERYPAVVVSVRAQRAFLKQVVHYLVAEAGIRQFLDIGTGLPSADNTHEVAQREAAESRVVYVDNDPIVLAHARALLTSRPQGKTAYIHADLRDTTRILDEAAAVLDFSSPVAVILLGILQCLPDEDDPFGIVGQLMDKVPAGSYLAMSQLASDVDEQATAAMGTYNEGPGTSITPRTHAQASRFLAGLDVVPPGLVQLHRWGASGQDASNGREVPIYGGVARKPFTAAKGLSGGAAVPRPPSGPRPWRRPGPRPERS